MENEININGVTYVPKDSVALEATKKLMEWSIVW